MTGLVLWSRMMAGSPWCLGVICLESVSTSPPPSAGLPLVGLSEPLHQITIADRRRFGRPAGRSFPTESPEPATALTAIALPLICKIIDRPCGVSRSLDRGGIVTQAEDDWIAKRSSGEVIVSVTISRFEFQKLGRLGQPRPSVQQSAMRTDAPLCLAMGQPTTGSSVTISRGQQRRDLAVALSEPALCSPEHRITTLSLTGCDMLNRLRGRRPGQPRSDSPLKAPMRQVSPKQLSHEDARHRMP